MKIRIALLFLFYSAFLSAQNTFQSLDDLQLVPGYWEGSLTYTDFSDDTSQSTIGCFIHLKRKGPIGVFEIGYKEGDGRKIFDNVKMKVLKAGQKVKLDGKVYEVDYFTKDHTMSTLVFSRMGQDNRRDAHITYTLNAGRDDLRLKKEVQYIGTSQPFVRNVYAFKRPL